MAHGQPVHEEFHRRLHPLCMKEVPYHLCDPSASRPGPQGAKEKIKLHIKLSMQTDNDKEFNILALVIKNICIV